MYTEERKKIYRKCMKAWGFDAQARVLQEECAELIAAVSHFNRGRDGAVIELAQELADTYIMVGQIIEYLGFDVIEHIVNCKLSRVKEKLEKEGMENEN